MNTTKISKADGEYRIRLFIDGQYQAGADYFTDDKQDAIETAAAMQRKAGLSDKTTENAKAEQAEYDAETATETIFLQCDKGDTGSACNFTDGRWYEAQHVKNALYAITDDKGYERFIIPNVPSPHITSGGRSVGIFKTQEV